MNKPYRHYIVLFLCLMAVLSGCQRNDDEPVLPESPISRLYISFSDYQDDDTQDPYDNVMVIDPADSAGMDLGLSYNSGVRGGSGIHFNPFAGRVFHGSMNDRNLNDTTIQIMTVSNRGTLGTSARVGNEALNGVRGLWYNDSTRNLYVANNVTPTSIFVFNSPMNRNGFTRPSQHLILGSLRPWGITMWGDHLLVARTGQNGGFAVFENISGTDSLESNLQPNSSITVSGASDIRGIAYSETLDILALSDMSGGGRVYVFENARALFRQTAATVTPTRTLSGTNTGIAAPIDVAIDDREGRLLLYVADRINKSILRFNLSANGNATPQASLALPYTPAGIFLDARGVIASQ